MERNLRLPMHGLPIAICFQELWVSKTELAYPNANNMPQAIELDLIMMKQTLQSDWCIFID
jgi:hypothetical protein